MIQGQTSTWPQSQFSQRKQPDIDEQQRHMGAHSSGATDSACSEVSSTRASSTTATTMMVRNIPCRLSTSQLVEILDGLGFSQTYDLAYVVMAKRAVNTWTPNRGYGFINFLDPADAQAFLDAFSGYRFQGTNSTKVGEVQPARVQGFENCLSSIRRSVQNSTLLEGSLFVSV
mmetsp:Transcript_104951/g.306569  ORF Transcript_104951/g.306569 Transcript_104951/m.306569 type:complete len:173 (+) Transcript_104951:146-664(+)